MSCHYEKRLDIIAAYVRGDLDETEQEAFETHYLGCEQCFRALRFVQKTTLAMHHYGDSIFVSSSARTKLHWLSGLQPIKTWWDELPLSIQWKSAIPALAIYILMIAILSAGYYWITSGSRVAHYRTVDREGGFLSHPSDIQLRNLAQIQPLDWSMASVTNENPAVSAKLAEIRPIYQAANYHESAKRLNPIAKEFPNSIAVHLLLGVSQLLDHKLAEAVHNLQKVLELNPQFDTAQWYLAQAYLIQGRLNDAQTLLIVLKEKQDSQYSQPAANFLEAIEKLGEQN